MTMNERVKQLRQSLGLSQAKFAQGISISNGYIAGIELDKRKVNDRIIKLICAVYGASESWLKTGDGGMFDCPPGEKLDKAINLFKKLTPEFQDYVLQQIEKLLELQNNAMYKALDISKESPTEIASVPSSEVLAELYEVANGLSEDERLYLLDIIKALKLRLGGDID